MWQKLPMVPDKAQRRRFTLYLFASTCADNALYTMATIAAFSVGIRTGFFGLPT